MNYPQGTRGIRQQNKTRRNNRASYSNRGMTLEEDINVTNLYYLEKAKANIHKKPTPIQIVNVRYPRRSAAVITEAYFQAKATTDYNGIYRGKYIDFEAKETNNTTSFPFSNVQVHQIEHMRSVQNLGGISFLIVRFTSLNETFYYPIENLLTHWDKMHKGGRKSLPYKQIKEEGYKIPFTYHARVDYLPIIDQLYFS